MRQREAVEAVRPSLSEGLWLPEITEDHPGAAQSVCVRHRALDLDLADAVNVALAAHYDADAILTLDRRDFRAAWPAALAKRLKGFSTKQPQAVDLGLEKSG
ncbi:hypothetical protein [Streptomyces olivaceus]|uniref:hypothetical protein n=1 Tax=Streptomyces olivaceus TaxID=47716 RepID=UPI0035578606